MQPMGRKPIKFPSKTDCHPPKGYCNWWEAEGCVNKKAERQKARRQVAAAIDNFAN